MNMRVEVNTALGPATPLIPRVFNKTTRGLMGDGRQWVPLTVNALMEQAERHTGLSDWGDPSFMPALHAMVHSLDCEANLTMWGRLTAMNALVRFLMNRLELEKNWKEHPDIFEMPVNRPIFIVGFPRTGSTLLQRLLARDPAARSLRVWEMIEPALPRNWIEQILNPSRIKARLRLELLDYAVPNFAAAHEIVPGEPEECLGLLQNTMIADCAELVCDLPSYRKFMETADMNLCYGHFKKQLQTLAWRENKQHWVLKSPFHQRGLETLMKTFPDALIIQTHRDPCKVVPSFCSLYQTLHEITNVYADPRKQGDSRLEWLSHVNNITLDVRKRYGSDRFFDVGFSELMADPYEVIRRIYDRAGLQFTDAAEASMRTWHAANPQHKRGVHAYTMETFGLDSDKIHSRLKSYYETFDQYLY